MKTADTILGKIWHNSSIHDAKYAIPHGGKVLISHYVELKIRC